MEQSFYPFSAIVGQEKMKTALLLNAVDPSIGGVLIGGHKGTGKSTAVRALARILPPILAVTDCPYHCPDIDTKAMCSSCLERSAAGESPPAEEQMMPFVALPLSATEDRVVGTLHVAHALGSGRRRFDPGLLAAANRGILYVDEVNLLDDHLVDILLDAAASGVNVVERDGISHIHPARFMLVGTMNPEEGQLRPQFLDRFGLSLHIESLADTRMREAVVRRRIAFDADPHAFEKQWSTDQTVMAQQIVYARSTLLQVQLGDEILALAVKLAAKVGAQGHRSEIVMVKTAKALAALLEMPQVEKTHLAEAARLVLPHRMAHVALSTPEALHKQLDDLLAEVMGTESATVSDDRGAQADDPDDWDDISTQVPGSWAASNMDMVFDFLEEKKKLFLTPMN